MFASLADFSVSGREFVSRAEQRRQYSCINRQHVIHHLPWHGHGDCSCSSSGRRFILFKHEIEPSMILGQMRLGWLLLFALACFAAATSAIVFDIEEHFRPGDTAQSAAARFCEANGVSDQEAVDGLIQRLGVLIREGTLPTSKGPRTDDENDCVQAGHGVVVNIDGVQADSIPLPFCFNDDPVAVANVFCEAHQCPDGIVGSIVSALAQLAEEAAQSEVTPNYPPLPALLSAFRDRLPNSTWNELQLVALVSNSPIPFLVLNLDRSPQRLDMFQKQWVDGSEGPATASERAVRSGMRRYPAVDGKQLHMGALKDAGIVAPDFPFNKRGNAGVALSHLSIWSAVVAHDLPFVAVFEDDVHLKLDSSQPKHPQEPRSVARESVASTFHLLLRTAISTMNQLDSNWDILYLGHNDLMCSADAQISVDVPDAFGQVSFTRPTEACMSGFFGYVISSKGAAKMVDLVSPLSVALDDALRPLYSTKSDDENGVNAYILHPPLVLHDFSVASERVAVQSW